MRPEAESGRGAASLIGQFPAQEADDSIVEALPLDPVCRMAVDPDYEAGRLTYEDVEYHFCSLECAQGLAERPERYASCAAQSVGGGS